METGQEQVKLRGRAGGRYTALLATLNLLNYMDRYLVAASLPLIIADLGLSYAQGAQLVSAFVIGYVIFSPIFGYLGDRWHRPRLMLFGVLIWSAATFGSAYFHAFWPFIFCRVMVGVGEASFGTIAPGYIGDLVKDPPKVTRALSIFTAAIPVGSALAYVVSGVVTSHFSWHHVFLVGAIPGLILGWLLLTLPEVRTAKIARDRVPLMVNLRSICATPVLWFAIGGYVGNAFALNGIATFVTQYGTEIGFNSATISQVFGIALVTTGIIGTMAGGYLSARLAARAADPIRAMLWFVAITSAMGVPLVAAAFMSQDHTTFLTLCVLAELCIFAGVGPINSVIVLSAPPGTVTMTQGLSILALNLGGALIAPLLIGTLADRFELGSAMQVTTLGLAIAAIVWGAGAKFINPQLRGAKA